MCFHKAPAFGYHQGQYRDHQVYYHNREQSKLTAQGSLLGPETTLCIIVDAMGQATFCVPRHLPVAKQLRDMVCPRLHTLGVIAHGWFKAGFLIDSTIAKDSDVFIEVVVQCIHRVFVLCGQKQIQCPNRLVIHADNAGDCKNQWVFALSALLTASGNCKVCFNQYLRTGHIHEYVDAMFGCWARHLAMQSTLETPEDFLR